MLRYDNCPNCFEPLRGVSRCPKCGYDYEKAKKYNGILEPFTILNGRYLLGRALGKGGFGVTYVAMDMKRNLRCAIKEYFPTEYAMRTAGSNHVEPLPGDKAYRVFEHGREKFRLEAKTLMELRNDPVVVDIWDYFLENNTAYLAMEYIQGKTMREMAKESGGRLDADFVKQVFVTVASSLMEIHKRGILHRDLSPENIMVSDDGQVKLIDFGAARSYVSSNNKGMSILLKVGFAPPEQYSSKSKQGPWSDVYALCATFYSLVSGKVPMDAIYRYRGGTQPSLSALGCAVTRRTSDVIERGMQVEIRNRYKDFKELMDHIDIDVKQAKMPKGGQNRPPHESGGSGGAITNGGRVGGTGISTGSGSGKTEPLACPYVAAIVNGKECNKMYLGTEALSIGRSKASCKFVLTDIEISRRHCRLEYRDGKVYLIDVSRHGTFMANGERLAQYKEYLIPMGTRFYLVTPNHMFVVNV